MVSHVHRTHRSGWMRAGLLGANDGVLSISGLMLGVAAAQASPSGIFAAGIAGLVAGALSMGALCNWWSDIGETSPSIHR